MKLKLSHLLFLTIIAGLIGCAHKPTMTTIPTGWDLFQTEPEGTFFNFEKMPIPAGFFAANSQPYTGTVKFEGGTLPSSYFNGQEITQVDTIVKREQPVSLSSAYPSYGTVSTEMTALSLISVEPIKVQVGEREEFWDVQVELSKHRPSRGTMNITKTDALGGTFESQLTVYPVFRFTRLEDGVEKILDTGTMEMTKEMQDKLTLRATQVPWRHAAPPGVLALKGMNDNFIAGAPALFRENGEACAHVVREPVDQPSSPTQTCTVTATRDTEFLAEGRVTVGRAVVKINLHEGVCNPTIFNVTSFLEDTTSNAIGQFTFGPVPTTNTGLPGLNKQVMVRVFKRGVFREFCCTTVVSPER